MNLSSAPRPDRFHRSAWRATLGDRRGAVALYASVVLTVLTGFGALTIDYGRLTVLRAEMQNAADAAAIAAARQLDGATGARARASAFATSAAINSSRLVSGTLTVSGIEYFRDTDPLAAAIGDNDAIAARVTLTPQSVRLMLQPVLNFISKSSDGDTITLNATALAESAPIVCNAPPLMVCDPTEAAGAAADLRDPANVGKSVDVREAASAAPGNYGLLCPTAGNCGASSIEDALAAVETGTCFGPSVTFGQDVTTAPGNKTGPVADGINNRFGIDAKGKGNPLKPAPNVIEYPRDSSFSSVGLGSGTWDRAGYWTAKHGTSLPAALTTASRYQTYLYELGQSYAAHGTETIVPAPATLPPGYTLVTPPKKDVPAAGVPKATPVDFDRRTVSVAILSCDADNVKGKGTYPTYGRYVDLFLTESDPGGSGKAIISEVVGATNRTGNKNFHANVRLVK